MHPRMVARVVSSKPRKANRAAASAPSVTRVGTPRLGSTRSQTCSMSKDPASISTLMAPVGTPRAAKAPLHADRTVAIGDCGFVVAELEDADLNVVLGVPDRHWLSAWSCDVPPADRKCAPPASVVLPFAGGQTRARVPRGHDNDVQYVAPDIDDSIHERPRGHQVEFGRVQAPAGFTASKDPLC